MANRRMFSFRIINSARFLQMPQESQNLYFHLGIRADDDGVAEAYPVMRMLGVTPDNLKVLLGKGFIQQLNEDLVVFVTDWHEHNNIRADRKIDGIYIPLLKANNLPIKEAKPRADTGKTTGGRPMDGIGKDRIGKVSIGQIQPPTLSESSASPIRDSEEIENQYVTTDEDGNEIQTKGKAKDTRPIKICGWYAREVERLGEKNSDAYIKGGAFIVKETLRKYPEEEIKRMLEYHLENNQTKFWHIGNALSGKSIVKFLNQ